MDILNSLCFAESFPISKRFLKFTFLVPLLCGNLTLQSAWLKLGEFLEGSLGNMLIKFQFQVLRGSEAYCFFPLSFFFFFFCLFLAAFCCWAGGFIANWAIKKPAPNALLEVDVCWGHKKALHREKTKFHGCTYWLLMVVIKKKNGHYKNIQLQTMIYLFIKGLSDSGKNRWRNKWILQRTIVPN